MGTVVLDAEKMTDRETMHDVFARSFALPDYYGRNLDALWDCLSERGEPCHIVLKNFEQLDDKTCRSLLLLFLDLCGKFENYSFSLDSDAARPNTEYVHFKGGHYVVHNLAINSETLELTVVYKSLSNGGIWVRPARMWGQKVERGGEIVTRFSPVEEQ